MNNEYKTYEELKEELGDKFDEYMYKSNIELLTKIDRAISYIYVLKNNVKDFRTKYKEDMLNMLDDIGNILGDKENE